MPFHIKKEMNYVSTPVCRKNKLNRNWYASDCDFWRGNRPIVLEDEKVNGYRN